jgi:hypothetical protein
MGRKLAIATFVGLFVCISAFADTITMKNGTTHDGTLVSATSGTIAFRTGGVLHHYPRNSVESISVASSQNGSNEGFSQRGSHRPENTGPVMIPTGTEIAVLTNQGIDSKGANTGQTYSADIANDVTDSNGRVVIPKGSPAELVLRDVKSGGLAGTREMSLDLESIKVANRRYSVDTADITQSSREGIGANKRTAEYVGGGTVLGTLIGAAAGGGRGAAIGAASGAAAGVGTQILTRGKAVTIPAESTLRFRLEQPLRLNPAY